MAIFQQHAEKNGGGLVAMDSHDGSTSSGAVSGASSAAGSPEFKRAIRLRSGGSDPNLRDIPKIVDKIRQRETENRVFFSFEYFPPKTKEGAHNLYQRIERMACVEPLFCDMTWGAGGSTSEMTLDLCSNIQQFLGLDVMMHLTCTNMPAEKVGFALQEARAKGIRNILALRGDPPHGQEWQACEGGFEHAVDLVRFIRKQHGDHFNICVAGYPEGHPAGFLDGRITYEQELQFLKDKLDAGADVVITQLFFNADKFLEFVRDCRAIGITAPILPGIMAIQTYSGFRRMVDFCKVDVPPELNAQLEAVKDDDTKVKELGVRVGVEMCQKLLKSGLVPGLHFYTLNLEKVVMSIIDGLDMIPSNKSIRSLPWRPSTLDKRRAEDVRPIFWANRPKSYLSRTATWDDYPNGRWGDRTSPAFGDTGMHYLYNPARLYDEKLKAVYGPINCVDDVASVFVRYCEGKVPRLPWSESDRLAGESASISKELVWLNAHRLFTTNSQPRVNAAPSNDVTFGWGPEGGYVFQKAYLEFFAPPELINRLFDVVKDFPTLTIHAASNHSTKLRTNARRLDSVTAVTWGVFPEREIAQPTVVDAVSFLAWKEEAFALWLDLWQSMYVEPDEIKSRETIQDIHDTWWLVNIVDHDFINGNIFSIFHHILPAPAH